MTDDVKTKVNWRLWVGRVLTPLPIVAFAPSGVLKLIHHPKVLEGFARFGFPESTIAPIGVLELACLVLYLVPQTAVLGAVLLTGFLGGAIVTHVRVGEPFIVHLVLGTIVWAGIYLREPRLHALMPIRR